MNKKKLLCLPIIAVLMLNISVIDNNVSAESNPTVYATDHEFYTPNNLTGTRFNVTVGIKNVTDLGCWEFKLNFNASLLQAEYVYETPDSADNIDWVPIDLENYTFHPDGPPTINNTIGRVWVGSILPLGPGIPRDGDFEFVKIQFQIILAPSFYVSPFSKNETVSCVLDLYDVVVGDSYATRITVNVKDGLYEYKRPLITMSLYGDVDDDGEINILDLKNTKLAYSGWILNPNPVWYRTAALTPSNDEVNILDLKVMKLIYSGIL